MSNPSDERLCLNPNNGKWKLFYSEKGLKSDLVTYEEERTACDAMLKKLKPYGSTK